ncbi:hypothetical protein E3U55_14975 [Filobacillus milosensis]|uniref:PepSY domain-containing protein n=1 Tax=Filobacillus milosensis TaxID=94137 RepID=A0A4Y8IDU5_9BACI|nr:PepSY domain-containing protein [Filobacillus milosensis]TFB14080.1 hypothetical protein E3U55_14975 [Filobacillus milosensis]
MKRKLLVGALASSVAVGGTVGATSFSDSLTTNNKTNVEAKKVAESECEFNMNKLIGVEELEDIVLSEVQGTIEEVELETKADQQSYFEVEVHNDSEVYEVHVNAYSGKVIKVENKQEVQAKAEGKASVNVGKKAEVKDDLEKGESVTATVESDASAKAQTENKVENPKAIISQEKAIKSALEVASGKVAEVELDEEGKVYDIELKGEIATEIKVDAKTGAILGVDLNK